MEKLLKEIEMELLKDKKFRKGLVAALINDYINNPKQLSFEEIKKRTQDMVRATAELELQEMLGEEEETEELLDN